MKLLSSLNEECNVEELSRYADEYYLGVCDEEWDHYHLREFNARGFSKKSNFSDWKKLEIAVRQAKKQGLPCYLTVNSHNIGSNGMKTVRRIIERFQNVGGEGIICSNIDAMLYAKEKNMKVMVSTISGIYNEDAVKMICELVQPQRIVLSRDMKYESIRFLRARFPDVELEVFGTFFGCKYSNAYCYCTHEKETGGMCRTTMLAEWNFKNRFGELDSQRLFEIEKNHWLYANYLLDGACSVCALYRLTNIGIDSVKIVGRELSGEQLLKVNKEMACYLKLVERSKDEKEYFAAIKRNPIGTSHLGCFGGYQCYYPEISNKDFW